MKTHAAWIILLLTVLLLGLPLKAPKATELIINGDNVIISGVVTDVGIDEFTLEAAGGTYGIDVTGMNLDADIDQIVRPGMRVAIQGDFDNSIGAGDPTIDAREMMMIGSAQDAESASRLLLRDDLADEYRPGINTDNEGFFDNDFD